MKQELKMEDGQMIDKSAPFIIRFCFIHTSYKMAELGRKGRHSHALLMRACDNPLVILTPTAPENHSGGGWGARTE